jgi:hypothetical protein
MHCWYFVHSLVGDVSENGLSGQSVWVISEVLSLGGYISRSWTCMGRMDMVVRY